MSEVLFCANGWLDEGRIQDGCHHQVEWERIEFEVSDVQLVWVRVLCKMWVNWGWQNSRMAAIIMLIRLKIVWVRVRDGVSVFELNLRWMTNKFCLNPRWEWLNPIWQKSRWLPSSSWDRRNEWSFFVQNSWIQDGRIQDGYHHHVESEWMSEGFLCK